MFAMTKEDVDNRIAEFVNKLTDFCNSKNINADSYRIVFEAQKGKKYTKIVRYEHWKGEDKKRPYGSVHCFIRNDGVIMKADSFVKVAKNGERGSIFEEDFDIGEKGRAVNQYGCAYIK